MATKATQLEIINGFYKGKETPLGSSKIFYKHKNVGKKKCNNGAS